MRGGFVRGGLLGWMRVRLYSAQAMENDEARRLAWSAGECEHVHLFRRALC